MTETEVRDIIVTLVQRVANDGALRAVAQAGHRPSSEREVIDVLAGHVPSERFGKILAAIRPPS
jgi:hypothetical protein